MKGKASVIVLGGLAAVCMLLQMAYEASEVEAGGVMTTQFRVVFWAQMASVVLIVAGMTMALRAQRDGDVSRRMVAAACACLGTLCPVWIASSALWPTAWSRWGKAMKAFPLETAERLGLVVVPAVLLVALCWVLVRRMRMARAV